MSFSGKNGFSRTDIGTPAPEFVQQTADIVAPPPEFIQQPADIGAPIGQASIDPVEHIVDYNPEGQI